MVGGKMIMSRKCHSKNSKAKSSSRARNNESK